MKTKLLKKIKKRFSWSYQKNKKRYCLLDHRNKDCEFFDDKWLLKTFKVESTEHIKTEISLDEYKWRKLKITMYNSFGYGWNNWTYNWLKRRTKNKPIY